MSPRGQGRPRGLHLCMLQYNIFFCTDSRNHWSFNGIVTTYLGVVGSWIFITLAATTNYVIAYKDSASFAEAQQTGINMAKINYMKLYTWTFKCYLTNVE